MKFKIGPIFHFSKYFYASLLHCFMPGSIHSGASMEIWVSQMGFKDNLNRANYQ